MIGYGSVEASQPSQEENSSNRLAGERGDKRSESTLRDQETHSGHGLLRKEVVSVPDLHVEIKSWDFIWIPEISH